MKRRIGCIAIFLLMGTFSWGQGTKESFDVKKSREELEIMRGILNTTLTFFVQNSQQKQTSRWQPFNTSNISSFYLSGQGAVFVIPTSGLRSPGLPYLNYNYSFDLGPEFSRDMAALSEEISAYARDMSQEAGRIARDKAALLAYRETAAAIGAGKSSGVGSGIGSGIGSGQIAPVAPAPQPSPAPPAPPAPAAPPTPPTPPAPRTPEVDREKLRKAVEDAQAQTKKIREEAEANREKFLKSLAEVKVYLVEALANYGDSLTTVKPEEYINLVLVSDGFGDQRSRSDVVSARKSWITDYKAGRLNMEAFKQKVIQYNQ